MEIGHIGEGRGPSKDETQICDYLSYIPVGMRRARKPSSSASGTTIPANPRDLDGVEISLWKGFADTVRKNCDKALSFKSEEKLRAIEQVTKPTVVQNEIQVEVELLDQLFRPLHNVMEYLGVGNKFWFRPQDVILDPDFSWASNLVKGREDVGLSDKILIEVKTPWAFNPPDDLVDILNKEMASRLLNQEKTFCHVDKRPKTESVGKKVKDAVSQLYGYLYVNHLKYGVLTTFDRSYFLRRAGDEEDSSPSKLEISRVMRREQTRDSTDGFTLMEAWVTILLEADDSHLFASPYWSPNPNQRTIKEITDPMKLISTAEIGNLYFGQRRIRGQFGAVVQGGIYGHQEGECVMKIVDTTKDANNEKKLQLEVSAYKKLKTLQGDIIPKVKGFLLINNWILVLVLADCGVTIDDHKFVARYDEIQSMVQKIHSKGVTHRDIANRNILVSKKDGKEKLTIIDFSEAKLSSDCKEEFSNLCQNDLNDLNFCLKKRKGIPTLTMTQVKNVDEAIKFVNSWQKPLAFYLITNDKSVEEQVLESEG